MAVIIKDDGLGWVIFVDSTTDMAVITDALVEHRVDVEVQDCVPAERTTEELIAETLDDAS